MKHLTALILKYVIVAIILEVVLLLSTNLTFGSILIISLPIAVFSYLIGDLLILSATNNTVATIADFAISFVNIYLFNMFWYVERITLLTTLIAAAVVGIAEWLFHKYLAGKTRI